MADYDDTNSGATFPPFDDMKMILQGKINVDGRDSRYTIVRRETRDGREILEIYEKVGAMFVNEGTSDAAPNYTGMLYNTNDKQVPYTQPKTDMRIAGWRRMKDDKPYLSIKMSEPMERNDVHSAHGDLPKDDIPF
jgi:hypothetical protein